MIIADTLSRLSNPENNKAIKFEERVDSVSVEDDQTVAMINFVVKKQKLLRKEPAMDPSINLIKEIVH